MDINRGWVPSADIQSGTQSIPADSLASDSQLRMDDHNVQTNRRQGARAHTLATDAQAHTKVLYYNNKIIKNDEETFIIKRVRCDFECV